MPQAPETGRAMRRLQGGRGGGGCSEANVLGCFLRDQRQLRARQLRRLRGRQRGNSVAVLLTYGTARILLDRFGAEANEEEYMANGSNTSSTPLFLSRFPPKVAVQCGADNPYGHPTPETLDRLVTTRTGM